MKIDFEFETQYGKFADALHLADDHNFSNEEIQLLKEERVDNWVALVSAPVNTTTPEDLIDVEGVTYARVI
jgi:hypothetical protein